MNGQGEDRPSLTAGSGASGFAGVTEDDPVIGRWSLAAGAGPEGTAWMAKDCLDMLEIVLRLANHERSYKDIALKFFEPFVVIDVGTGGLWDEQDGFFYDRLRKPDDAVLTIRPRSIVGLLPIFAAEELPASLRKTLPNYRRRALEMTRSGPIRSSSTNTFMAKPAPALAPHTSVGGRHSSRRALWVAMRTRR